MASPALLALRGVTKSFGDKVVLHPLDLEVQSGAFVALLGPSGCGKTTLLRMVAGLEEPTAGEIEIGGQIVHGRGVQVPPEARGLGMVFQSYAVWPHMTVEENVAYPLRVARHRLPEAECRQRVIEALDMVRMGDLGKRKPSQLSGGQQQRVALARGLAMRPRILLLDEPLSNLDARLRAEMRRDIKELHAKLQVTFLYVTHDQREAFEMASHIVLLNEGRIAQQGTPENIRAHPAPGFAEEFFRIY